ncbi:MAG: hypothetical protein RMJ31_07710 [Nitrososphaerota archaeon]|nr:hypothetical protein [Nitrososphaerota archaeon]
MMESRVEDHLKLKGEVRVIVRDAKTNEIIEEQKVNNLIVNVGKYQICDLLIGANTNSFTHCGVGSSNQTPQINDTDLVNPIGARKLYTDRFRTNNIATFSFFFASTDNNGIWRECGLFNAPTGGVMLARALFTSEIVKDSSKTCTIEWDIQVG